jgi:hypothetical protein
MTIGFVRLSGRRADDYPPATLLLDDVTPDGTHVVMWSE